MPLETAEFSNQSNHQSYPICLPEHLKFDQLVELLLRHGANPVQSNAKGKSALDIAASPDIKILLKKEIIASSSESSGLDEARSPTSPESNVSDRDDDRPAHDSQGNCLFVRPSAHGSIFCRNELREKVRVKVRFFIVVSQCTQTDFLSQTKHQTYLAIFYRSVI